MIYLLGTRFILSESEGLTGLLSEGNVVQRDGVQSLHHSQQDREDQTGTEHHNTTISLSLSQSKVKTNSSYCRIHIIIN